MTNRLGTILAAALLATTLGTASSPVIGVQAATRPHLTLVQSQKAGQRIALQNASNVRDLGGYVNHKGQAIKPHRLIRANSLATLSKSDERKLVKVYHLKTDVDLRTLAEQKTAPDKRIKGVRYVSNPVFLKWGKASGDLSNRIKGAGVKNMETFYRNAVLGKQGRKAYRTLFQILLKAPKTQAVLWHCSAGKDRAGIGTMLILSALGFDKRTIQKDYLLSNKYLAKDNAAKLAADKKAGFNATQLANAKAQNGVQVAFLNAAYRAIDQKYGSVTNYLHKGLGLSKQDPTRLQKNYLTAPRN